MMAIATRASSSPDFPPIDENLTPRESRASCAASRQGLILRRLKFSPIRDDTAPTYELVYARYNHLVANDLKLSAVEDWLNIRSAASD